MVQLLIARLGLICGSVCQQFVFLHIFLYDNLSIKNPLQAAGAVWEVGPGRRKEEAAMTTDQLRQLQRLIIELRRVLRSYDLWFTDMISGMEGNKFCNHMGAIPAFESSEQIAVQNLLNRWVVGL